MRKKPLKTSSSLPNKLLILNKIFKFLQSLPLLKIIHWLCSNIQPPNSISIITKDICTVLGNPLCKNAANKTINLNGRSVSLMPFRSKAISRVRVRVGIYWRHGRSSGGGRGGLFRGSQGGVCGHGTGGNKVTISLGFSLLDGSKLWWRHGFGFLVLKREYCHWWGIQVLQ